MKQQILIVHGGDVFLSHEEYLTYLQKKEFSLERLRYKGWKATLEESLGAEYEVFTPRFPRQDGASYTEWKLWFAKMLPILDDNAILIGTSLGGIFLAKYLAEEKAPKKVLATFLIAAPYDETELEESLGDFALTQDLDGLIQQGGKIFLYHSEDDPVVPFADFQKYQKALPNAQTRIFKDKGHFAVEELPEIVEDIKSL